MGVAGPQSNPVYAKVIAGAAPTEVLVQTSLTTYVAYVLVGGP